MNLFYQELIESLKTGFLDQTILSNEAYLPQFLVNDRPRGKMILTTLIQELKRCETFWFSVAFVTKGGVTTLINTLKELQEHNIKGKILVSQYQNFTQPEALKTLLKFSNIELKIIVTGNFHAKGYLFKRQSGYDLIVGSSNLTAGALRVNQEWNLKVTSTDESKLIQSALTQFQSAFDQAVVVDNDFIAGYERVYQAQRTFFKVNREWIDSFQTEQIIPNKMQQAALNNLSYLREQGEERALLISATGTGKTYLSAFDLKQFNPKRFLFVVHRNNIARAAMRSFRRVFGKKRTMGLYSGNDHDQKSDFIFATIQTLSRDRHLKRFKPDCFDYIVIDETHRAGAESYQKILNYFKPKFLLGMSATPERTDGFDIFKLFNHTIAYEIRLHGALEAGMLTPFHYFGITDVSINGVALDEKTPFNLLVSEARVDHILEQAQFYGTDSGVVRGLVFCRSNRESVTLSEAFNRRGLKTVALSGRSSEEERIEAIDRLESDGADKLDYIFTVDIFNEGIDIPRVNQVIMLRPTESAIVFVQQLGRGLRKREDKSYLTVIDFIGNYQKSYLVPVALFGDHSYNKDQLRKLMSGGGHLIPGRSTVNFDHIAKEQIFKAIDSSSMRTKRELVKDYELLQFKLGRTPMMIDFIKYGSRDPWHYVRYSRSYFNFAATLEGFQGELNRDQMKLLELFAVEINNGKRPTESLILKALISQKSISIDQIQALMVDQFGYQISQKEIDSALWNLNLDFIRERQGKKEITPHQYYNYHIVEEKRGEIQLTKQFQNDLKNALFQHYLLDNIAYALQTFERNITDQLFCDGFILYQKYSRKDVFRLLNWRHNPKAQSVGGYMVAPDQKSCPIFVNYHKSEDISESTKYDDHFIDQTTFNWMSKSKRTLKSPDVKAILDQKSNIRLPLFIKKSNDEGRSFYYMGDVVPIKERAVETTISGVSVVQIQFKLKHPVEEHLYHYITNGISYH